jgi:hypothetical protein
LKYVPSDFEWDPEINGCKDADEPFSTAPPKRYKAIDHTKEGAKKKDQGLGNGRLTLLIL